MSAPPRPRPCHVKNVLAQNFERGAGAWLFSGRLAVIPEKINLVGVGVLLGCPKILAHTGGPF